MAVDTLSDVGKNPVKKAVVVGLPTIESAFVSHTTKGIQGWQHPDHPAVVVAQEILNASEGFLWVRRAAIIFRLYSSVAHGDYRDTSVVRVWHMARTVRPMSTLGSSVSRSTG